MSNREYDETNRFALFPNDRMRDDRNDPDLKGFINIEGREYWFSAWSKYNRDGSLKVINGSIGDEREQQPQEREQPAHRGPQRGGGSNRNNKSQRR
jgi:hypothetical protein